MIQDWSARQVHDTVAAILTQPEFAGGRRQSLIGRFLRFVLQKAGDFLAWISGSVDARFVVAAAVGLIAAIVIARIVIERRAAERRRASGTRRRDGVRVDHWTEARALAVAGRHTAASHELYAAVLDLLARAGQIRYDASKTNGEYFRELRRGGSAVAGEFRGFARDFDASVFGTTDATADDYARLESSAERIAAWVRRRAA